MLYLLECKMRFRPLKLALKREVILNSCTNQNKIALNQTMRSQTKACIATSSCEISNLLRYYTAQSDNSLLRFPENLLLLFSRVNKSKRENTQHA